MSNTESEQSNAKQRFHNPKRPTQYAIRRIRVNPRCHTQWRRLMTGNDSILRVLFLLWYENCDCDCFEIRTRTAINGLALCPSVPAALIMQSDDCDAYYACVCGDPLYDSASKQIPARSMVQSPRRVPISRHEQDPIVYFPLLSMRLS